MFSDAWITVVDVFASAIKLATPHDGTRQGQNPTLPDREVASARRYWTIEHDPALVSATLLTEKIVQKHCGIIVLAI